MAYRVTEKSLARRIAAGRGQGEGENYAPFICVHEIASKGVSYRFMGWKTGRVHQLLSTNEMRYFMVLEWNDTIQDIREQYPILPRDNTQAIAATLHVRHPRAPGGVDWPVTTDFVLTVSEPLASPRTIVRTVKPAKELDDDRVKQKLAIEKHWWHARGIDWKIVRDIDIPIAYADNVAWLHGWRKIHDLPIDADQLPRVMGWLDYELGHHPDHVLAQCGQRADHHFGLPPGTGMAVVRHLLAIKHWSVPMHRPIRPLHVIPTLRTEMPS